MVGTFLFNFKEGNVTAGRSAPAGGAGRPPANGRTADSKSYMLVIYRLIIVKGEHAV
jgi:hypothetical protein